MFNFESTEKEIVNLFALLTAIKTSAENLESDEHSEAIINLSNMANEKLSSVWKEVSETETKDETEIIAESKPLAEMVASILSHPDIPDELFHAVISGLDEIADIGRFKTLRKLESSPEYISKILSDYSEAQTK